jgi:nucleoside triphosphate diphosphatase
MEKLREESEELLEARASQDSEKIIDEVGDLLFVASNIARFLGVDPETALGRSNRKFERRFRFVESETKRRGRELKNSTLEEMDSLWDEAKKTEHG